MVSNPSIELALDFYPSDLKVDTPFNIDKFASLLADHPNRPFVESVISGLRHGFWPLDDGEWDLDKDGEMENYPAEEEDLAAIREFRDKELASGRWSGQNFGFPAWDADVPALRQQEKSPQTSCHDRSLGFRPQRRYLES